MNEFKVFVKCFLNLILVLSVSCNSSETNKPGIIIIPRPGSIVEVKGFCKLENKATLFISRFSESTLASVFSVQINDYLSVKPGNMEWSLCRT
jgi:hypothetical protein